MNWIDEIKRLSDDEYTNIVNVRRHLHKYPELSFQEFETAKFISAKLDELGIEHSNGIAGTGIHGVLTGKLHSDACIFLRADMDALPIQEENTTEYCSQNPGVMHACGHDVHSASLLGALSILKKTEAFWGGNISFVFQPGEEKLPGGASRMIEEGVLDQPRPIAAFAQHVYTPLPAGKVGFRPDMYMASSDELYIHFIGKGGHGAMPEQCINPILMGADFLKSVYAYFEAAKPKGMHSVLSFGKAIANGATNVIPETFLLEGTFRTLDENWRRKGKEILKQVAQEIEELYKAKVELNIVQGYPSLKNDPALTMQAIEAAKAYLGEENVEMLDLRMTSEDFAYFTQVLPSCFYRLGTGNPEKGIVHNVHHARFDIDEEALKTGMGLMAYLALNALDNH